MSTIPLRQICRLRMGETIIARDCTGSGVPIFSADTGNRPWAYSSHTRRHFHRGTIVIGARGSIGNPRLPAFDKFSATQTTIVAEPNRDELVPEYLLYTLHTVRWNDVAAQQAIPMLTVEALGDILVTLPAKQEQAAIARVLTTADSAIEQTESLLEKYQRLRAGLIHDLFERGLDEQGLIRNPATHSFKPSSIGTIPEAWEVYELETLVQHNAPICYGIVQVGTHSPSGVPTIAIRDFANINLAILHRTAADIERGYIRSRCVEGDLLLSIKATTGEVAIAPRGFKGNISRDVARIRLRAGEVPAFFKYQLQSEAGRRRFDEITVGTTRREISIAPLRKLLVARPHPDEQRAIATKVESVDSDLKALSTQLDKLRLIKNGLMNDLLTNQVPVIPLLQDEVTAEAVRK